MTTNQPSHMHGDPLEEKLGKEITLNEAREKANNNAIKLKELEKTFQEFGLYTILYVGDMGGHKGLSGHYGRLHVFTGGEQSEYVKYMVFSFDRETGQSEQVWYGVADYIEPRFSDDKPIFYSRTDGKKAAMKKAAQYNCLDIIDENGYLKKEEYDKRLR